MRTYKAKKIREVPDPQRMKEHHKRRATYKPKLYPYPSKKIGQRAAMQNLGSSGNMAFTKEEWVKLAEEADEITEAMLSAASKGSMGVFKDRIYPTLFLQVLGEQARGRK